MKIIDLKSIDSTNTYLKENYLKLENNTFVSAIYQSSGFGRNGRKWDSEIGGLYFSQLILDQHIINNFQIVSILSAYSILEVIQGYGLKDVMIKWPNDVYVKQQKICGILLQAISKGSISCLIVGVGLNVNQRQFASDYLRQPTSLSLQLGYEIDLVKVKNDVYQRMIANLDKLKQGYDFYEDICKYNYLLGKEAYGLIKNEKKKIKIVGLNRDYSLNCLVDGQTIQLNSGEVTFHV